MGALHKNWRRPANRLPTIVVPRPGNAGPERNGARRTAMIDAFEPGRGRTKASFQLDLDVYQASLYCLLFGRGQENGVHGRGPDPISDGSRETALLLGDERRQQTAPIAILMQPRSEARRKNEGRGSSMGYLLFIAHFFLWDVVRIGPPYSFTSRSLLSLCGSRRLQYVECPTCIAFASSFRPARPVQY
ncbi:uncharacterized protein N7482_004882 [Penicillium canariense]|uniref:Uncharacterized protein n=1 Tax=Penicillium canariense TaxID=189055 RepID=A0A9W9I1I1_9EURO|nr:uncharacterized protein N7482_004882 [Penicillium canariense]KAJ5166101.1 hypothetical protein N7482_004882 [Penicillium canariense]